MVYKKCEHGKRKSRCKDCHGSGICIHNKEKYSCKDCGGTGICIHNKNKSTCKDCHGSQICSHNKNRSTCKNCNGSQICDHGIHRTSCKKCRGSGICKHNKQKNNCKECGTHRVLRINGFSIEQIKEIGRVKVCQFPNCMVQNKDRSFHSDHLHDGNEINKENYRGEICWGHNTLVGYFDTHPEWVNEEAKEYMIRRPYKTN